jgi:hypothetical protein
LGREFWLQHEHVDYEQLVGIADNKLDPTDREILDIHFKTCAICREDVRSFLTFRDELATDAEVSFASALPRPPGQRVSIWTRWIAPTWKPAYVAAIAIIAIAIIAAVIIIKRKTAILEAVRTPLENNGPVIVQTPTPESTIAERNPAPAPSNVLPKRKSSPTSTAKNRTSAGTSEQKNSSTIALNDNGGRTVTIDQAGNISGLDDMAPATRDAIAEAVAAERIETSNIVEALSGPDRTLRGPNSGTAFKLLSPGRTVIINDRPLFEWEKFPGAASYRVYVGDLKGHEIAKSEELSPARTSWTPPAPLKRGGIYSWAVAAVVDGKEVLSPGAAGREMKFQILPSDSLQELNQLKKARSHLALGVFYARVGILNSAEHEFQKLVRLNPESRVAINLLRAVQLLLGTQR